MTEPESDELTAARAAAAAAAAAVAGMPVQAVDPALARPYVETHLVLIRLLGAPAELGAMTEIAWIAHNIISYATRLDAEAAYTATAEVADRWGRVFAAAGTPQSRWWHGWSQENLGKRAVARLGTLTPDEAEQRPEIEAVKLAAARLAAEMYRALLDDPDVAHMNYVIHALENSPMLPPLETIAACTHAIAVLRTLPGGNDPRTFRLPWGLHVLAQHGWLRYRDSIVGDGPIEVAEREQAQRSADAAGREAAETYLAGARRDGGGDDLALPWLLRLRHHFRAALAPGFVERLSDGHGADRLAVDVLSRLPVADDLLVRRVAVMDPSPTTTARPVGALGPVVSVGGMPPTVAGRWFAPSTLAFDLATIPPEQWGSGESTLDRSVVPARLVGDVDVLRAELSRAVTHLRAAVAVADGSTSPAAHLAALPGLGSSRIFDKLVFPDESSPEPSPFDAAIPEGGSGRASPLLWSLQDRSWGLLGVGEVQLYDADEPAGFEARDQDPVSLAMQLPSLVSEHCRDASYEGFPQDMVENRRRFLHRLAVHVPPLITQLETLAALDAPALAQLFVESIDPLSHRLDAWFTGMAHQRLAELRQRVGGRSAGARVGGYGWVEDLRPDPDDAPSPAVYVHAPSLQHAATAAVLRSGRDGTPDTAALTVDLGSRRARTARWLLAGVRRGVDVGTLLGYRIERALHDTRLDVYVAAVREAHPGSTFAGAPVGPVEGGVGGSVADGLAVVRAGADDLVARLDAVAARLGLPSPAEPVREMVTELAAALDAVGDLVLAESVHQILGGNPMRAGLAADTLGRGEDVPDDWAVLRTPHRGRALTHELVAVCPPSATAGWGTDALSRLEPGLDAWLSARLGPASALSFELHPDGEAEDAEIVTIAVDRLGWSALRLVLALASPEQDRLVAALAALGPDTAGLRPRGRGWVRLVGLATRLHALAVGARPLLELPGRGVEADVGELAARLTGFADTVTAALALPEEAARRRALDTAGVVADLEAAGDAATRLGSLGARDAAQRDEGWLAEARGVVGELVGAAIPVLPMLHADAVPGAPDVGPAGLAAWLARWADIRPTVRNLQEVDLIGVRRSTVAYQDPYLPGESWICGPVDPLHRPGARYHVVTDAPVPATPFAAAVLDLWSDVLPGGDALGVDDETAAAGTGGAGDRLNREDATELTGLAFRADRPDAKAPNALLLAVPPDPTRGWSHDQLALVVHDALELGKLRSVDLGDLPMLDDVLPLVTFDQWGPFAPIEREVVDHAALPMDDLLGFGVDVGDGRPHRPEPLTRTDEVATGIAARVHDAAWFLARQWQLGEFSGEDAATPVEVTVEASASPVHAWRPRRTDRDDVAWAPYDVAGGPLEATLEGAPEPAWTLRDRMVGGTVLTAALEAAGIDPEPVRAAYPLDVPDDEPDADDVLALAPGRAMDAGAVVAAVRAGTFVATPALEPARDIAAAFAADWAPPAAVTSDAFDPHRFEHGAELAVGEHVLALPEYDGAGIDWVDVERAELRGPAPPQPPPARRFSAVAIPAPVRNGGLPADRFWEMEDALVDLASTRIDALDTGRMMLLAFATVYGNDWFTVPIEVPFGALTRLDAVTLRDAFGRTTEVGPAAGDDWAMYSVDGVPGLFVPPSGSVWTGPTQEAVRLVRDEAVNVVWAIEGTVMDERGRVVDRRSAWWRERDAGGASAAAGQDGEAARYVLETTVPDYWLPLVAQATEVGQVRFRLVPLDGPGGLSMPRGRLLTPDAWVHEEEVPRTGVEVTRRRALARARDGTWWSWARRSKLPAEGEAASGLVYDAIRPSRTWPT